MNPLCIICGDAMTEHPNGNFYECFECRCTVPLKAWGNRLMAGGTLQADLITTIDCVRYHAEKTADGRRLVPLIREAMRLLGADPSDEEVAANLAAAGIDMRPAYERMHKMVALYRAREAEKRLDAQGIAVVPPVTVAPGTIGWDAKAAARREIAARVSDALDRCAWQCPSQAEYDRDRKMVMDAILEPLAAAPGTWTEGEVGHA